MEQQKNFKESSEFKEIYDSLNKIENERIKKMMACKQYYKKYDVERPAKKPLKVK